jgi:hypothetical protein
MGSKPWISGPKELLDHGLEHLQGETDFDIPIENCDEELGW